MNGILNFDVICDEMTDTLKQITQPEHALQYVKERFPIGQRIRVELTRSLMNIASIQLAGDPLEVVVDLRDETDNSYKTSMWPVYQTEIAPADPFPNTGWGGPD